MSNVTFTYACKLYDELAKDATVGEGEYDVFTGSRVGVFRSLNISQTYYTPIYSALEETGCLELLERGRAGFPSVMALYHPPDEDEFTVAFKRNLTKTRSPSILDQRVSNLEGRLGETDLSSVLVNFEQRIAALERMAEDGKGNT